MLLTKEVEVIPHGNTIKYYREKGYNAEYHVPLIVKVEDLPHGSSIKIEYLCDYCKREVVNIGYSTYVRRVEETGKMACKNCAARKREEVSLLRYGVKNYAQTEECREKMKATTKLRYGVEHYSQTEEYKEKTRESMNRLYGVEHYSQTEEYKERHHNTCTVKYGEDYNKQFVIKAFESYYKKTGYCNPSQSPEVREKIIQSYIDNYGCSNPNQVPEVREKITQTLYENGSQKVSKQQKYISDLYQGILNFPVKYYNVDIYLPDDNLVIEFDGGGHMLNVITGRETIEEYNQKEIVRSNVIKREGYKQMRIISTKDLLPRPTVLLEILAQTKQYFSKYPNHSWIEFNIDASTVRNAEQKDGVFFNFGDLYTVAELEKLQQTA